MLKRQASKDLEGAMAESMAEEIRSLEDELMIPVINESQENQQRAEEQQLKDALEKSRAEAEAHEKSQLKTALEKMGYPPYEAEAAAAECNDLEAAVAYLSNPQADGMADPDGSLTRLISLGFSKEQAEFSLSACAGDVDAAMNLLLGDQ